MKLLLVALCAALVACEQTDIVIQNDMSGAAIENARWMPDDSSYDWEERMEPGESSEAIAIGLDDEGASGVIHFELVANGRRVALVTDSTFVAATGELSTFRIGPETPVHNPLAE